MRFSVICADPPWSFDDRLARMKAPTRRGAASQYATMSVAEIRALKVNDIVDPMGTVLALWVPSALLVDGLEVMKAWGFTMKGNIVWVKTKKVLPTAPLTDTDDMDNLLAFGMGRLFRAAHEVALIGTSGKSVYPTLKDRSQRSVIMAPTMGHSCKPDELQFRLETMFPGANRCELFARRPLRSWTCVGDAIDGKDINDAIQELAAL